MCKRHLHLDLFNSFWRDMVNWVLRKILLRVSFWMDEILPYSHAHFTSMLGRKTKLVGYWEPIINLSKVSPRCLISGTWSSEPSWVGCPTQWTSEFTRCSCSMSRFRICGSPSTRCMHMHTMMPAFFSSIRKFVELHMSRSISWFQTTLGIFSPAESSWHNMSLLVSLCPRPRPYWWSYWIVDIHINFSWVCAPSMILLRLGS